jgi:5-methylcytosine-specific restriction endonuclease McrA
MNRTVRALVRRRAANRCEYCRLPQRVLDARLQVEHIVAKQHRLDDDPSNLALACDRCNQFKGTNLSSIDPESGLVVPLFHPRHDVWAVHFAFSGPVIVGLTPTGRATVTLLRMNESPRIELRMLLLECGETL